jgi:uncharacterized protein (TIGR02996 family)
VTVTEDEAFIRGIVDSPGDDTPRLVYADWLDDRADPRGPYLRAEAETVRRWREAGPNPIGRLNDDIAGFKQGVDRMSRLTTGLDPVWVARVSRAPFGACCDHVRFSDPGEPRPALTPADLDWVEKRFELTLPADYRAFLLNYNGGNPEPGHFRIPGRPYEPGYYELATNFPSVFAAKDPEIDWECDLVWRLIHLDEYREYETRWQGDFHRTLMIVGLMPPAEPDVICLGCRGKELGRVYGMTVWLDDDSREERPLIAGSFAEFLGLLTDHDLPHIRAIRAGDVAALVRWLDAGGDVDEVNHRAPLVYHAVIHAQPAVLKELLARGARLWDGLHDDAKRVGNRAVIELLRAHAGGK